MAAVKKEQIRIAVCDAETDPFEYGTEIAPFSWGFYDGENYVDFWGVDCSERFAEFLRGLKGKYLIYAHNGGKFDMFFMLEHLENPIFMINGRIVEAGLCGQTFRDSYSIFPMPLAAYQKDDVNYEWFKRGKRERYKAKILDYLKKDCIYLHELVSAFAKRFTPRGRKLPPLTIGSTALRELRKFHPQKLDTSATHDDFFRQFYYGGRVQCFETGIQTGDFKIYDVNSMYPAVMKNNSHPYGHKYVVPNKIQFTKEGEIKGFEGCVFFVIFDGETLGHIPYRNDDGGIDFLPSKGRFFLVSHEFKAAYSRGLLHISGVIDVRVCCAQQDFSKFVDEYGAQKVDAKRAQKSAKTEEELMEFKRTEIMVKLILNSSYGKFSQNPRKFRDYHIEKLGIDSSPEGVEWRCSGGGDEYRIWEKPIDELKFNDVAIAASITSAARACLLDGILRAKRVVYCDTDSLICEDPRDLPQDDAVLGSWKYEGAGDEIAIAGKKMYCLAGASGKEPLKSGKRVVKKASKGVRLTGDEIFQIAAGGQVTHFIDAPAYNLKQKKPRYTARTVKKT